MDAYIYCADIYCEDCGKKIRAALLAAGKSPAEPENEGTYDSDEYPKGPFQDGGGESDSPNHCGSGPACLNAFNGAGVFLENPLTQDGYDYVRELMTEDNPSIIVRMWAKHYDISLPECHYCESTADVRSGQCAACRAAE